MVTLRQLVEEQKYNKMNDLQVIAAFFNKNNLEEEGMELIHQ